MRTNLGDSSEHRKEVWRAVRKLGAVLLIAPVSPEKLSGRKPGLTVFADERTRYCDGRVPAETIDNIDGREVIYIPLVEPEEKELDPGHGHGV